METNNKLRVALTKILNLTNSLDEDCAVDPVEIRDIARAALAVPPRNCEVGTEHEQHERFKRYCDNYGRYSNGDPKCDGCQLCMRVVKEGGACEFVWGQMPYEAEEGGAE